MRQKAIGVNLQTNNNEKKKHSHKKQIEYTRHTAQSTVYLFRYIWMEGRTKGQRTAAGVARFSLYFFY